jgi:tetratricopeptide (TPR) repeat protein
MLFDRRMACLRQRRSSWAGRRRCWGRRRGHGGAGGRHGARAAAATLCEDDERLLAAVAPPEDPETAAAVEAGRGRLARLQALERSGRYDDALLEVPARIEEATRLGYLPYQAEVQLLAGKLQMQKVEPVQAREHLDLALQLGVEARLDELAAEALGMTIFSLATAERRTDEALAWAPLAWALVRRAGSPPLVAAHLHNVIGVTYHERADETRSIQEYAQALALLETFAPEDPLRWPMVNNMAVALGYVGQHERAQKLARGALVQLEQMYDVCHPHAAALQVAVAGNDAALGAIERGVAGYERALTCFAADYPEYALITLAELGQVHLQSGDAAATMRALGRADELLARFPDSRPRALEIELLRADLAILRGASEEAQGLLERLRGQAPPVRESDMVLRVDTRLGLLAHLGHDDARALELLQSAETMLAPDHNNGERGLFAFTLARALQALGREPERVGALVDEAIEAYETSGAHYAGRVAEIRAWQARAPE